MIRNLAYLLQRNIHLRYLSQYHLQYIDLNFICFLTKKETLFEDDFCMFAFRCCCSKGEKQKQLLFECVNPFFRYFLQVFHTFFDDMYIFSHNFTDQIILHLCRCFQVFGAQESGLIFG